MSSEDLKSQTLSGFISMMGQFLDACSEVWPEDDALKTYLLAFQLVKNPSMQSARESFINEYHESMKPFFERCNRRDVTLFTEECIDMLREVNMRAKWLDDSIDNETRDVIWQYVLELNKLAQMYVGLFSKIPSTTLDRIQQTAVTLAGKISAGEMTPGDLNLASIGQEVVDGLSEEEISAFTENLLSDPSALANLAAGFTASSGVDPMQMAQSMMGGGQGGGAEASAMAMAMQMLQQQGGGIGQ